MRSETLFKHDLRTRIVIFLNLVTLETAGGKIRIWLNFSKGKILVPVCNLISAQLNTGEATLHKLFSRNSNSHRYYSTASAILCTKLSCQGEELNKHLASVPIPKPVLYVFACILIVKLN